jgi:hypothetical protein
VWLVADNTTDTFAMYSRGGPYAVTTRLPASTEKRFGFRNGTAEALDRFAVIPGRGDSGTGRQRDGTHAESAYPGA